MNKAGQRGSRDRSVRAVWNGEAPTLVTASFFLPALFHFWNPNFVSACVPLVADTYLTDPAASKALLERIFDPERLNKFAYIEVPALARKIAAIAEQDTEFAVSIYARVFGYRVDSDKRKSFNNEQIMPLSGSESDMYGSASYSLAEHFPGFFKVSPAAATEAVVAMIEGHIATRHPAAVAAATKRLCELASDPHPTVRLAVAMDLALLFDHAPARMWKVADLLVKTEQEPVVLAQLIASTFRNLRNNAPARIESMVLHIRGRFPYESVAGKRDARTSLWEHSAQLLAALYVWNDRKKSGNLLFEWAVNPVVYFDQIRSAVYEVRTAVTRGYDADSPEFKAARMRIQALLTKVVDHSAGALEAFHALSPAKQKQRQAEGKAFAHALEYACAPLYYGSGAHNEKNLPNASPVLTDPGKGRFVKDVEHMLGRLGDIAIPHTVYHLIRVLDFLLPGDPALCFDLFAHALTVSGRKYGFQGESLGVDVLVRFVSAPWRITTTSSRTLRGEISSSPVSTFLSKLVGRTPCVCFIACRIRFGEIRSVQAPRPHSDYRPPSRCHWVRHR